MATISSRCTRDGSAGRIGNPTTLTYPSPVGEALIASRISRSGRTLGRRGGLGDGDLALGRSRVVELLSSLEHATTVFPFRNSGRRHVDCLVECGVMAREMLDIGVTEREMVGVGMMEHANIGSGRG